jgi:hypothetical protein
VLLHKLYVAAWERVRTERDYRSLTDELLWHKVYEEYISSLPPVEPGATRDELIERHLRILGPIAGQIAWKRCPKSFGIWVKECQANLSHVGLVHELAAFGVFGLVIAADRYAPNSGRAFSTYANFWIKKFIRLYLEEIVGIVPRSGHMGDDEPRRSVVDLVDAALEGHRLYRGKAARGMAMFDSGLTIPGPIPADKEIEVVGSDGPTDPTRLDYLQRHVGKNLYPWIDMGTYSVPRHQLPGHPGGRASAGPTQDEYYELGELGITGDTGPNIIPAEICYLDRAPTPARYGLKCWHKPVVGEYPRRVMQAPPRLPNTHWIMTDRGWRRGHLNQRPWQKPTCEEEAVCDLTDLAA